MVIQLVEYWLNTLKMAPENVISERNFMFAYVCKLRENLELMESGKFVSFPSEVMRTFYISHLWVRQMES